MEEKNEKQLSWLMISLIAFNFVWGLGNVVNNFAQQGIVVITSWLIILVIYFIPYSLMIGQLGSTFEDSEGGVSDWIKHTSTNIHEETRVFCRMDILGGSDSLFSAKTTDDSDCTRMGIPRALRNYR